MEWMSPVWLGVDGVAVTGGGGVEVGGSRGARSFQGRAGQGRAPRPQRARLPGADEKFCVEELCACVVVGAAQMSWGGGAGGLGAGEEGLVATPWEVIVNLGSGAMLPCRENSSVSI